MNKHVFPGVMPEPLASYLAGLGLIRLLGEQVDPAATFAWTADGLAIETSVDDVAAWLAEEYVPTPVLSPWNGGSGFGFKDVEPKKRLSRLMDSPSPRLTIFKDAIKIAENVVARARSAGWMTAEGKGDKQRLVLEFRNRCPEVLLPWIDACVVLAEEKALFPPLLGTGGNDGRLDFSTNFHEQLLVVLDESVAGRTRSIASARDALAGIETERLATAPVGQFDPASAGGQGSSPFGAAGPLVNPWTYVLLVEGALLFASGTSRRHQHAAGRAAMPFTVSFSPDGSTSGAAGEESRGEVWAPVWTHRCTLGEIRQLFGEARAAWRGRQAKRAVDFYAATRALGVTRGVSEFVRYGLQQRNGLAFVAVPLDRVQVVDKPEVRLAASIEDWVSWIPRGEASRTIGTALRRFESAHLRYVRNTDAIALRDLLAALTSLELAVGRSGRLRDQIPVRRPPSAGEFLGALTASQESAELRIAVGVASCIAGHSRSTDRTMRQLLLPIDPGDPSDRAHRTGRWRDSPVVPGFGIRPLRQLLADVLAWRSRTAADEVEAGSADGPVFHGVPTFRRGVPVPAGDLHSLAAGRGSTSPVPLDDEELDSWLCACLALDWRRVGWRRWAAADPVMPVPTLSLLHPLAEGIALSEESPRLALGPDWAVRLAAGQVASVHADAASRLRQAGWDAVPAIESPRDGTAAGTAIAAALVPRCAGWRTELTRVAFKINETPELQEELS